MGDTGYALDLLSPVRHVATMLDRAAPAALSVVALANTYDHAITGDLTRIREHEHQPTGRAATEWLIRRAVDVLARRGVSGEIQIEEADGGFRLAVPFDELRYLGKKLIRTTLEDDEDARRELRKVYADLGADRPLYVLVAGARGGVREQRLSLHPLARAIPQIGERDFEELAADIRTRGVRNAITLFDGRVLDGRHRLAIASALKIPLRTVEFAGTEDQARDEVISQNVTRRHLTVAQRTLIVQELFLPQAEREARARYTEHVGRPEIARTNAGDSPPDPDLGREAKEVAAERSGGLTTVRTLHTMDPVRDAPETQKRVREGKITTAAGARKAALEEQGKPVTKPTVAQPRSAYDRLGCALGDVRSAHTSISEGRTGNVSTDKVRARIEEIREHLDKMIALLADGTGPPEPTS